MLPLEQKIAFLLFAAVTCALAAWGFYRVGLRIRRGAPDPDPRFDRPWSRLWYALTTTITQQRTFRRRPWVSIFHAFIVYGFAFYILVNILDGLEGFLPFAIRSSTPAGAAYNLCADISSLLVLVGVVALALRRYLLPSRHDFDFNSATPLEEKVRQGAISLDSAIVFAFIFFHVGSRVVGEAARVRLEGGDRFQPFASLIARALPLARAQALWQFGYWGALGSVLLFLLYFPWSKHIHIFFAPIKYFVARAKPSGQLPPVETNLETASEANPIGARLLQDLAWPRLLDAYACIQCNRCQDACPATATGKALSPSALEINKRMELNHLAGGLLARSPFERGEPSTRPLLAFALSPEALWACTTCGACMEVCPVGDEPMLDIVDIRRNQVMMEGQFPAQLQAAFRGMERAANPWGIGRAQRLDWARGLSVPTIAENPGAEVLFWVGCAASYDPQAQRTARALVALLLHAKVDFAVLGQAEGCTGDSARRAGNEYLYRQLAEENVATLNRVQPKLILTACPHCMNSLGREYRELGGHYRVVHHTQYLEQLMAEGRLTFETAPEAESAAAIAFHDPCYLGRHNGIYDAPRTLLRTLGGPLLEMERSREKSFCCGAGGAQFWKEEEPGRERISENRLREAEQTLAGAPDKILAVGCPFCKNMLAGARGQATQESGIAVKDIAELLVERLGGHSAAILPPPLHEERQAPAARVEAVANAAAPEAKLHPIPDTPQPAPPRPPGEEPVVRPPRKQWKPKS
ncbi:MAG TPA: (Fe-S)-binding protein [Acidobacteriaceae bacterium]|jgi:Fe-S oxidoreductase|nr:(Fe-S)-binding protein [Acidobacteriaceae bacterium]